MSDRATIAPQRRPPSKGDRGLYQHIAQNTLRSGKATKPSLTEASSPGIFPGMKTLRAPLLPEKRCKTARVPRPSRVTVPARANPLAKLVFGEMAKQNVTYFELEMRSGVLTSTFKAWRTDNAPGLASIEAALGSLGWCLVPVPRMDRVPQRIKDGLDALNAEWGREEPLLHHLLASACLAPILVEGGPAAEAPELAEAA